jgi:tRNAThr (cytosine32-N3)-methyltransferase
MATNTEEPRATSPAQDDETRFTTDNSVSKKPQPKQQLSKSMQHMRFAVTADPIPHSSTPPLPTDSTATQTPPTEPIENDAYGIPASFAPVRAPASRSHDPSNNQKRSDPFAFGSRYLEEGDNIFEFNAWDHVSVDDTYRAFSEEQFERQRADPVSDFDRKRFNDNPENGGTSFTRPTKQTSSRIGSG